MQQARPLRSWLELDSVAPGMIPPAAFSAGHGPSCQLPNTPTSALVRSKKPHNSRRTSLLAMCQQHQITSTRSVPHLRVLYHFGEAHLDVVSYML